MALFEAILGSILGGVSASETNEANIAANQANIAAAKANQEKGLQALTGGDAFQTTTRTPGGGFDVTQPGAPFAAEARTDRAFGDIERAGQVNRATNDFAFTLPNLSSAQGIVDRDIANLKTSTIDPGIDALTKQLTRASGGLNISGFPALNAQGLGQLASQFDLNRETNALDLFNKQGEADLSLLSQIIASFQPQERAPGFTTGGPGGTAANVIAQTPPARTVPDLGGAIPFAAGGNLFGQLQAQEERDKSRELLERLLKNQGIF